MLILYKYKDIMQPQDKENLSHWTSMVTVFTLFYVVLWVPFSFSMMGRYRADKVKNSHLRVRALMVHLIQLPVIFYSATQRSRVEEECRKKYLSDLSDYEVANFGFLYQQL